MRGARPRSVPLGTARLGSGGLGLGRPVASRSTSRRRPGNPGPAGATSYYTARTMGTAEHVKSLDREGQLLVAAARSAGVHAPVPSCPGWEVRDLLAHIGFVHRWAARYVAEGLTEMVEEPDEAEMVPAAPSDDTIISWVADGHAALVEVLSSAPPDVQCWTFLPAPSPLAFWARRQAHETAVHRVDAELAAGGPPTPVDPAFAVDGTDEVLLGFFARPRRGGALDVSPGTIGLEADRRWAFVDGDEFRPMASRRKGGWTKMTCRSGAGRATFTSSYGTGSSGTAARTKSSNWSAARTWSLAGGTTPTSPGASPTSPGVNRWPARTCGHEKPGRQPARSRLSI